MSKKISELPAATTLTNDDELVVNHVDTSGQEPETITSKMTVTNLKGQLGINGKADKVNGATSGDVATLDSNGNLVDSGKTLGKSVPSDAEFTDTQSDWNQTTTTAKDYIKNKPTIPAAQIQSDWNQTNTSAKDYIKNKPTIPSVTGKADKVSGATNGNVATLDANGNLADSGKTLGKSVPADAEFTDTQSDWSQTSTAAKDYIKNKPTLGTASAKDIPASGNASSAQVVMGSDTRLTDSRPASDVSSWAKASTKPSYTASEVGAIATTAKGANGGVAELDSSGKVPSSQLPSFVDDVLEYSSKSAFPATGETGKIYVATDTNKTYRWSGTAYVEISESVALGETSSTAYRGDRGKTAYDHSQTTSGNPHNVTKSDVGLGNVGNFKAVSTAASQGLTATEKANARTNIGAGTSNFSGSYNDLTNKPTIPSAQVNSDWNATSGVAQILNKPTIPDVSGKADKVSSATSGDVATLNASGNLVDSGKTLGKSVPSDAVFTDTKNTAGSTDISSKIYLIGATSQAANPQTYSQDTAYVGTDGCLYSGGTKVLTAHQSISGKADKVSNATSGNFAGLDSNGNLIDSGHKHSDYLTQHQDISGKADKVSGATSGNVATLDSNGNLTDSGKTLGKSVPSDAVFTDTNNKVTQTNTTGSADYRVLLSENANDTTQTVGARKSANLKFNPSTGNLQATQLNGVNIGSSPKFTDNDTKNTAGSTDSSSKLFLIGATSQAANPQTYSHDTAYVGTDGCLYSNSKKVLTDHQDISGKADKVTSATNGNFAGLDSNGNLTDSGKKASDFLTSHQTIKQDGVTGATANRFGTCSTAAGTAAKTVSVTSGTFSLEAGARVSVKFSNANTASTPTLNVGGTGAKNIYHKGSKITTGNNKGLLCGTVDFIYDGTQYHIIGADTEGMATDGSNASNSVIFSGTFTVGSRASGSIVGTNSVAAGNTATASGSFAHAEGFYTTASNECCHAEGIETTASGSSAHAEGYETVASALSSHAEGFWTTAGYDYQHVSGKFNDNKSTTLFEVGNGTGSNAKSNALEVYSSGDLNITGEYKKNGSVWTPNDPNISDAWVASHAYAVGDYCIEGGTLYKCTTAHTSAAAYKPPYASYWTAVKVGDELKSLNSGLTDINTMTLVDSLEVTTGSDVVTVDQTLLSGQYIDVSQYSKLMFVFMLSEQTTNPLYYYSLFENVCHFKLLGNNGFAQVSAVTPYRDNYEIGGTVMLNGQWKITRHILNAKWAGATLKIKMNVYGMK